MCLSSIVEQYDVPVGLIQSGWKHFSGTYNAPLFEHLTLKGNPRVPLDQWLTAEGGSIKGPDRDYKAGFHVWTDEMEVRKMGRDMRQVYYRLVHTRGTQGGQNVAVAKQIYVPSKKDAWPPKG